jgi:hypothetical protein
MARKAGWKSSWPPSTPRTAATPSKASASRGPNASPAPFAASNALGIALRHGRNLAYVLVVYSTFKWMLPALAAVTPPGVDLEAVKASAEYHVEVAKAGCGDPCKAMSCPAGWKTALHAQDPCKCICARVEAATAWDAAQREKEKEGTHGAAVSGPAGASKEAAAAAAARADKLTSTMLEAAAMQQGSVVKADSDSHDAAIQDGSVAI